MIIRSAVRTFLRLTPLLAVIVLSACGGKKDVLPKGNEPDKFLYDRGTASLEGKHWLTAREYFRRIIDSYPQSNYRPDAKLGLADSYLGEDTTESLILAVNEYREFLTFYPTNPRADYAQYKLGMTHFKQMRASQRDQSETVQAIAELEVFVAKYPNSQLMPEVQQKLREARDRLSTHEYEVGTFYYKQRWYPGAIDRLKGLLKEDPGFTGRDGAYFYLAEALVKVRLNAEALPYYEKLIAEFETSEFLAQAKQRRDELRATLDVKPASPTTSPTATPSTETPQTPASSAQQAPAPAPTPAPAPPKRSLK
jgi:outer membrane protein assembly factor BamD